MGIRRHRGVRYRVVAVVFLVLPVTAVFALFPGLSTLRLTL